jgi:transcriptional regulator with XRE-family HTH domain
MTNDYKERVFLNTLARRIATLRKERGFTQEKLAAESGIDRVAIANIERGHRRPTVTTLFRMADAMGISVGMFFD